MLNPLILIMQYRFAFAAANSIRGFISRRMSNGRSDRPFGGAARELADHLHTGILDLAASIQVISEDVVIRPKIRPPKLRENPREAPNSFECDRLQYLQSESHLWPNLYQPCQYRTFAVRKMMDLCSPAAPTCFLLQHLRWRHC